MYFKRSKRQTHWHEDPYVDERKKAEIWFLNTNASISLFRVWRVCCSSVAYFKIMFHRVNICVEQQTRNIQKKSSESEVRFSATRK